MQAMGMGNAGTSSAGGSWISTLIARMPYAYRLLTNITEKNPKYEIFQELEGRKAERVQKLSTNPTNESAAAIVVIVAGESRRKLKEFLPESDNEQRFNQDCKCR